MEDIRKEMTSFWRKFGKMLRTGVPIVQTLTVIRQETPNKQLKEIIQEMAANIKSGKTLFFSLAAYPSYFSPSIQTVVKAGEMRGDLDRVAIEIADGLEDGTFNLGEDFASELLATSEKEPASEDAESSVIQAVTSIISDAVRKRASDIHIERFGDKMRVRYRIDGVLEEIPTEIPEDMWAAVISRIKIMADMDVGEKRLPQDGRIRVKIEGRELDLRVCIVPYITGESIVMRILDRSSGIVGLESQGFSDADLEKLRRWSKMPNGVIIATGPTGCGKTTTLYAALQELNTTGVKITTVEDPVEYQIDGINQQAIKPAIGLTFARAIRSHLRQDPDIMLVGEIRDYEMALIVIQAALTGHLVMTTLHTQDAPETIRRLIEIGIEPFLINSALTGVVSQRLVRMVCNECREEYTPEEWVFDSLKLDKKIKLFRGKGCEKCHQTGYRGRTAVHELLEMDDKLKKLVAKDVDAEKLRKQAISSGMVTLREDGIAKAAQGITTIEEVLRVCPS